VRYVKLRSIGSANDNTTFKEILYLENYIVADYNMSGHLAIDMPDKLDMPPGGVTAQREICKIEKHRFG
jgi:hypothetical protein